MKAIAALSMLHEPPGRQSAGSRVFRDRPVIRWTLERLERSVRIAEAVVLCWEDQRDALAEMAVENLGPRRPLPMMEAISAARRWSDGWRGGLLGTCWFDRGFFPGALLKVCAERACDAVVLVDPAAGLVDPMLLDTLVEHAEGHPEAKYVFAPAAPGLSGFLLRKEAIERLAASNGYPGRLLSYCPDAPVRDPLAGVECAPTPTCSARTASNFLLDTRQKIRRMEAVAAGVNGPLIESGAKELVERVSNGDVDEGFQDVVIELNTHRATNPLYWPGRALNLQREPMTLDQAAFLFGQLDQEVRVTFGGVGDPLLHDRFFDTLTAACRAGIVAKHVETDLLGISAEMIERLAAAEIDVVSVYLPAMTTKTYQRVMGVDGLGEVLDNLQALVSRRHDARRLTPIIVPTFVKCRENLGEMEGWYDQWLKAVGSAVILGPSDYGGQIADVSTADLSPPRRVPCRRLRSRMSILSDGRVVSCEEDVQGVQALQEEGLGEAWRGGCARLRQLHAEGRWDELPLCARCREWHRP